jgi:hypothetical protein
MIEVDFSKYLVLVNLSLYIYGDHQNGIAGKIVPAIFKEK